MGMTFRRKLAIFFLSAFKFGGFIQKLYPIAVDLEYSKLSRENLDLIRHLLVQDNQPNLIRVGDKFDGGYAISPIIHPSTNCISVGVGTNVSFDIHISKRLSTVHLYDHTVSGLPADVPQNVVFFNKGLGKKSSETFITLEEMVAQFPSNSPLILKMDIEGFEWEILENITESTLLRFDQIVLELHHFHQLNDKDFFDSVVRSLKNLKATHQIVNRHANNWARYSLIHGVPVPDVLEVTYVKREEVLSPSVESSSLVRNYSSPANFPCNPTRPDISLYF
ncbi:methyltransferase [Candidatus Planktophila lacus]|uniref:FkbM family methyltransferase n=1 Tax=Candidatus Planktophila lacus TaxID=1884913 RepID=UPI000BAC6871|nr:FkbM family methyltransferase [Candidatus Planktophila lacus]ASY24523.1 methyltransferase [Candidatus Planktophila lacus]